LLKNATISSFRVIGLCAFPLHDAVTVIAGANGSGKTSLLEALYFASNGRSFRTRDTRKLLRFGDTTMEVKLAWGEDTVRATYESLKNEKIFTVNGDREKISDISAQFPFFVFHHRSLAVVRAGNADRYRFINRVVSRFFPGYGSDLATYRKALYQKRVLLKKRAKSDIITSWNRVLQERRERLTKRRQWFCGVLNEKLGNDVQIQYMANQPERHLDEFLDEEQRRCETVAGSQLDRFRIVRQGRDVKEYSSSGQQKDAFFQILTSVGQLFQELRQTRPVLLLDDFDAEFDDHSRNRNLASVLGQFQVIVTTTDSARFGDLNPGIVHSMNGGEITTV